MTVSMYYIMRNLCFGLMKRVYSLIEMIPSIISFYKVCIGVCIDIEI